MDCKQYRYFYSLLPPREQHLFEVLFDGILARNTRFSFDLGGIDLNRVVQALSYDCPELYHVRDWGMTYTSRELWFTSSDPFLYSPAEDRAIRERLREIVDSFAEGQDDFGKELAIHAHIVRTCKYDRDYAKRPANSRAHYENHSMIGPLIHGIGVCSGFSRAAQYLMLRLGIPAVYCVGRTSDSPPSVGHAWLIVQIRGNWYHLDISHDVCLSEDSETPRYVYFNVSDREIRTDHSFDPKQYERVKCLATAQNYYKKYGRYYFSAAQARDALVKILSGAYALETGRRIEFRVADGISESDIGATLREVLALCPRATEVSWSFGVLGTVSAVFSLRAV